MFIGDRVVNPKFNKQPIVKPLLSSQQPVRVQTIRFQKFGHNLGPSRPVLSVDKYKNQVNWGQSPMFLTDKAKYDLSHNRLVNQTSIAKQMQDKINQRRKQSCTIDNRVQPKPSMIGVQNLTFSHQGITNVLQSPNFYRSYSRPSDTKAVANLYAMVESQVADSKNARFQPPKGEKDASNAKQKSPFLFSSLRKLVSEKPIAPKETLSRSKSSACYTPTQNQSSFVNQYANFTQMLNKGQAKALAQSTSAVSSLTMATRHTTPHKRSQTCTNQAMVNSSINIGMNRTAQNFFRTNNQHAVDQLQIGSKFNKTQIEEFTFTRYKKKATSNYDSQPAASRHKLLDNRQQDFQMRITVDNGEPGLPVSNTTVHKPILDAKRFVSVLPAYADAYRENICHSFVSVKNNRILQKSAQRARQQSVGRERFNSSVKRKQGGGLFAQRVPARPKHAIDCP